MPNNVFPIRDMASKGVLRDPSSYQLDLNAFSNSNGVMYHANKAQSAPVIRQTTANVTSPPQWVAHFEPTEGYDAVFTFGQDGKVGQYQDQDYHDVSASDGLTISSFINAGGGYSISANSTQVVPPPSNESFHAPYGHFAGSIPTTTAIPIVIGYTYTGPTGETALGAVQAYTIPTPYAGIMVSGPALVPGATGWNLYAGTSIQAPPAAPVVSTVVGGSTPAATSAFYITYVTAFGETPVSPITTATVAANHQYVVSAPTAVPGVTGWNIYAAIGNGTAASSATTPVNSAPIPIQQTTYQLTPQNISNLLTHPPTQNTAVTALSLQTSQQFFYPQYPAKPNYLGNQGAYAINAQTLTVSTAAPPAVGTLVYQNFPTITLPPPALPATTTAPTVSVASSGAAFSASNSQIGVVFVAAGKTPLTGATGIGASANFSTVNAPLSVTRPDIPAGTQVSDWAGWAIVYNTNPANSWPFPVGEGVDFGSSFTAGTYTFFVVPVDAYGNEGDLGASIPLVLSPSLAAAIAPALGTTALDPSIVAYNVYYQGTVGGSSGILLQTPTPVPLGNVTILTTVTAGRAYPTSVFAGSAGGLEGNSWFINNSAAGGSGIIPIATTTVTAASANPSDTRANYYNFAIPVGAAQATAEPVIEASDGLLVGTISTNPGNYPPVTQALASSTGARITPPVAPAVTRIPGILALSTTFAFTYGRPSVPTEVRPWTTTFLGQVLYANRPDGPPIWFNEQSAAWSTLPNMDSAWTARSMRAFGDYLIALNVTKPASFTSPSTGQTFTGGNIDNLFKWSDVTLEGQTPPSWDYTDPTTSAGENPLDALTSPIVDGLAMRNLFLIFTETEVWGAQQSGDNNIFNFFPVFDNGGMLAPNCGVSVEGIAYVFGTTDIYKTDGTTKVSIVDKRNRDTIFRNLNARQAEDCAFALYMPSINCVLFAYPTGDDSASFNINNGINGCNQGALYDIQNDTWGFVDLPNVFGGCMANADTVYTWEDVPTVPTTANWITFGGSWYDQQNTFVKLPFFVAQGCSATQPGHSLNVYDYMTSGNRGYVYNPNLNAPAFAERTGIALDQLGSDLRTYKRINRLYPLVSLAAPGQTMNIQVGWSNTPNANVAWEPPVVFDPINDYKIDVVTGGRYLAIRFSPSELTDFEIAGFDASIQEGGKR